MTDMTEEVKSAFDDIFGLCFTIEDRVKALERGRAITQGDQAAITDDRAEDAIPVFTVVEGGRRDTPKQTHSSAVPRRSDQGLGRWKQFSMRVTPQLSEFIERYVRSQPEEYLRSDILHDAMVALCQKQGLEIDWQTAAEEGPLIMGNDDPDEPCPDPAAE